MAGAPRRALGCGLLAAAWLSSGCQLAPRQQLEDCRRLSQTLRSENARLKDEALALRNDIQDYSERAVDDGRRLAMQAEAIRRLEASVLAYQDERSRMERAVRDLQENLAAASSSWNSLGQLDSSERRPARSAADQAALDGRDPPAEYPPIRP